MDKKEFVVAVCKIRKTPIFDYHEREVYVSVNRAHYGQPSSAIIAFEGSPARLEIFVDCLSRPRTIGRTLVLNGRLISESENKIILLQIIDEFLAPYLAK